MRRFSSLRGSNIFVTGHTGFTGGWAVMALSLLGARVHGFSLPPPTDPSLFDLADIHSHLTSHHVGDVSDVGAVIDAVRQCRPDIVLHLAAEPLVLAAYRNPVRAFATNAQGTVHVLEAARLTDSVTGVVAITTDKVYAPGPGPYRENDAIGGHDPYAASKAAAEMAILGYRQALPSWNRVLTLDVARGGNIIGGGDFASDRIIPDYFRAQWSQAPLQLRHPSATRPWQHVLCLVHGYLALIARILDGSARLSETPSGEAWNFGPSLDDCVSVSNLLDRLDQHGTQVKREIGASGPTEAPQLTITSDKARERLSWVPALSLDEAVAWTAEWYRSAERDQTQLAALSQAQTEAYFARLP